MAFMHSFLCVAAAFNWALANETVFETSSVGPISTRSGNILFNKDLPLKIVETYSEDVSWSSSTPGVVRVEILFKDDFVSIVSGHKEVFYPDLDNRTEYGHENDSSAWEPIVIEGVINITAKFIGFNELVVKLIGENDQVLTEGRMDVWVLLLKKDLVKVYQVCLTLVFIVIYTNMGANLDLALVKAILKEPVGPAIGLFCQYVCMPLIAYGLGLVIFPNAPLFRLGLFASGSSPGGGLSNMWTHLLGGSLDLSIMMTFCSTVVALGAVPTWLLTLGKVIVKDADFVIPYTNVLVGIAILILPCFAGILIQLKFPKITKLMRRLLTPLSLFNITFILTFGVYTNAYLFSYLTWAAVGAGFMQTILGHIAGFVIAFLLRRPLPQMIAVSIETAVQNNGIAFLLLKMSLDKPAGDLAVLIPGCVGLFTPLLLVVSYTIKITYEKVVACREAKKSNGIQNGEGNEPKSEARSKEPEMNSSNAPADSQVVHQRRGEGVINLALDMSSL